MVVKLEQLADSGNRVLDGEARALLVSARQSLDSARRFTDSAQAVVEENRDAVAGFANQGMAQVGPALADLRAALRKLQRLADELEENPAAIIGNNERPKEYDPR
jgi:phospholipid/cholesterol/gamma-HCH transport system substrate-binding protein